MFVYKSLILLYDNLWELEVYSLLVMDNGNIEIGKVIKKARIDKGLTIRELAEKTGITSSMISQIERDLANPSINTLKTLSIELDVPVYMFFKNNDAYTEDLIVRKDQRVTIGNPTYNMTYDLLIPNMKGNIEFCMAHFGPKNKEKPVSISHKGEETAVIISGKINIIIDGNEFVLNQGDSVRIPPMANHCWINPYDEVCELIFAVSPPTF